MGPEQIRIGIDHLRLKPQAELHSTAVDVGNNLAQAARQLLFINPPVAQAGEFAVSIAIPAIIENEGIHARTGNAVHDLLQSFGIEVKIRGFPAVDNDGTLLAHVSGIDEVIAVSIVKIPAHTAEAFTGIGDDHLGCFKVFAGLQLPHKVEVIDAAGQQQPIIAKPLRLQDKGGRINQIHAVHIAGILRGVLVNKCHERV